MKMTTLYTTAFLVCLSGAALAIPQAPHDAAHNVSCADCHTPYAGLSDPVASVGAADATSTSTKFVDLGKTWTASQWVDGVITFTSGANLGQFRTITASDATSVSWALPLANAFAAGDTYKLGKTVLADIETKCTSCHNPTGPAYTMSHVGLHQTDIGAVSCSKCHEPHNVAANSGVGNGLIRATLRLGNGIDVVFPSGEANKYIKSDNKGLCQVCHTKTKYFKADGSGAAHNPDPAKVCTDCHKHEEGFGGAALVSAHGDATAAAFTHFTSFTGSNAACARCHSGNGFIDYIGGDGSAANQLTGTIDNPAVATSGKINCASCHNAAADALNFIYFPSGLTVTGLNKQTAICGQCHQGRESTVSVNSKLSGLGGTQGVSSTATGGTTTTLIDTTKTWTSWNGASVLFTSGANIGVYRTVTATTANQITWLTPLPAAIASGVKYQIVTNTSGNNVGVDAQLPAQTFVNVHYLAAAASLLGDAAKMAFQYPLANSVPTSSGDQPNIAFQAKVPTPPGASAYNGKNPHGVTAGDCTSCHNKHSLEVTLDTCGNCHTIKDETTGVTRKVASLEDLENMRQFGYNGDIDGDGIEEGIKVEVDGLAAKLLTVIQTYAVRNATLNPTLSKAICYSTTNPYWFVDTNGDGVCSVTEAVSTNTFGYVSGATGHTGYFTERLLRAAYNYQYNQKDPGAWAHNPRYIIAVLYDTIVDLNKGVVALGGTAVPFTGRRSFFGHFDGSANALHLKDGQGGAEFPCLRCHSSEKGMKQFLANATPNDWTSYTAVPGAQGFECTTCHAPQAGDTDMKRLADVTGTAGGVKFPGHWAGGVLGTAVQYVLDETKFATKGDMICSTCHGGRDMNGAGLEQYLDGTYSAINVPGRPFYGATASIADNGAGFVRLSGLPAFLPVPATAPAGTTTSYNWLYTTSCQAINKFVTISGASVAGYNGTWKITGCTATGTADLALAFDAGNTEANNGTISWASWAAGTKNNHDIQGAGRMFGSDAHEGYEYAGKTYAGRLQHHGKTGSCGECHSPIATRHTFETSEAVAEGVCAACHTGTAYTTWSNAARNLTTSNGYDGDPTTTTLATELNGLMAKVGIAISKYAQANGIVSVGTTSGYPCWSATAVKLYITPLTNTTGICLGTETASWSGYDPKVSRAMYNVAVLTGDPGAWAHNFDYVAQLLYDSIVDLGGDTTGLIRP